MKVLDFTLSPVNLKDIPFQKYDKNFTFIFNGKRYQTTRVIADLLSPSIRKLHFIDETIDEFYINNDQGDLDEDHFEEFLNLCTFDNYQLDSEKRDIYSKYFYKLGNIDEYFRIHQEYFGDLTVDNAIDRLILITNNKYDTIENSEKFDRQVLNYKKIIEFISSHFEDIDKELMRKLPIELVEEIMMNESLHIEDEDSLMKFALSMYDYDQKYSVLFEYVIFYNVSERLLKSFIYKFDLQFINQKIWGKICSRLLRSTIETNRNKLRYTKNDEEMIENLIHNEFKSSPGKEFNGIMHFLTHQTDGNIHENGTIEITSNSIHSSYHPKHLVDYNKKNYYHSKNIENSFVCFDFKEKSIQLNSYSIRSHNSGKNCGNLRNWVLEVSNDGNHWIEVDRHLNDDALNGPKISSNFDVKNQKYTSMN